MSFLDPRRERQVFQTIVLCAAIVPILAGAAGIVEGPRMAGGNIATGTDLESHFRYLSGLLLGIGLAFAFCALAIERRVSMFRVLALIVVTGGIGRLLGAIAKGLPGTGHLFGLLMELVIVPLLLYWLQRIERLSKFGE